MNADKISKIKSIYLQYANVISLKNAIRHLHFNATNDGSAHIEIDNEGKYNYIVTERGSELQRKFTDSLDCLLYWIFSTITFSLAMEYELKNRKEHEDFRRLLFCKQIELLNSISLKWGDRRKNEIQKILAENPYVDVT